jgi:hypothetical protein
MAAAARLCRSQALFPEGMDRCVEGCLVMERAGPMLSWRLYESGWREQLFNASRSTPVELCSSGEPWYNAASVCYKPGGRNGGLLRRGDPMGPAEFACIGGAQS